MQRPFAGGMSANTAQMCDSSIDGKLEKASTTTSAIKQVIVRHDWHRLGGEAVKVGPIGQYLDGP